MDHIVLNVANPERSLEFYSGVLGMPAERVDLWRSGKAGFPSVRVNEHTIIDLATRERTGQNLSHFCLVVEGDPDEVRRELESKGIRIPGETKARSGARQRAERVRLGSRWQRGRNSRLSRLG
jgi:catechol 2,3-dioxygenase-like lactoylglutathione lyase family enzyme